MKEQVEALLRNALSQSKTLARLTEGCIATDEIYKRIAQEIMDTSVMQVFIRKLVDVFKKEIK